MRRTDPLIVGGGPSACAAAILLGQAGHRATILERTRAPQDIVCGGFISADTIGLIARTGLSAEGLGGHPIRTLRIVAGARTFEAELPFAAFGLSRRTLDAALIAQAARMGAGIERGVAARRIDLDQREVHLADGAVLGSDAIMLATGKHDLRGAARPAAACGSDPAIGFRARLEPTRALYAALDGVIELHVFRGGYVGLLLLEDGGVNLCLSVARSRLASAGNAPGPLLAALGAESPQLADRLGGALSTGAWSSIANIPYGWRAQTDAPGVFRLGDQGAVIASLAGDGIGIALASGCMAADTWTRGGAGASGSYQAAMRSRARRPLRIAGALKWLAEHPLAHGPAMALMAGAPGLARLAAHATRIGDRG